MGLVRTTSSRVAARGDRADPITDAPLPVSPARRLPAAGIAEGHLRGWWCESLSRLHAYLTSAERTRVEGAERDTEPRQRFRSRDARRRVHEPQQ